MLTLDRLFAKMYLTLLGAFALFIVCALGVLFAAFAGDGLASATVQNLFLKWFKDDPGLAITAWTILTSAIGIGLRVVHKKVPGSGKNWYDNIAALLFGDGVVLENNTDRNFVKTALMKKYPWAIITEKQPEVIANENAQKLDAALNARDTGTVGAAVDAVLPPS